MCKKYLKCATPPFKIIQITTHPLEYFKFARHPATNFQMCNTLRETFNVQHSARNFQIRVSCTERPQSRRREGAQWGIFVIPTTGAVCLVKLLDSASHVAAFVVAIFATCFPGLVVRSCRSRYQLVYVWVPLHVYYSEC